MLKLILVPLDTSRFAEQALPHAIMLARRAGAKLQLVCIRAAFPPDLPGPQEEAYLSRIAAQLEPELPHAIMHNVVTDELGPIDPPPDSNRVAGVLWRYAREHDADLIVMATHGRGGLLRAWLGSVANSLIRRASRPVLLVRPQDEVFGSALEADRGIRHIVVPLDGSTTAEQVIPYALAVGSPYGARYSLVRVIFPPEWNAYQSWAARVAALGVSPPIFMESDAAPSLSRQEVAESLESVANRMREGGVSVTAHVLEEFSPAEAIVQYAQAHAADAVAVSTGGVGGVPRLLLGSVADRIVRTSEIPVLVCNVRRLEPVTEPANEAVAATSQLREET